MLKITHFPPHLHARCFYLQIDLLLFPLIWNIVLGIRFKFVFNLLTIGQNFSFVIKKRRQNSTITKKISETKPGCFKQQNNKINKLSNFTQHLASLRRKIHFDIREIRSSVIRPIFREAIPKYNNKHRSRRRGAQLGFGWTVVGRTETKRQRSPRREENPAGLRGLAALDSNINYIRLYCLYLSLFR